MTELVKLLSPDSIFESSELINGLEVQVPPSRNLTTKEIEALEKNGNSSPDWSKVKVCDGFKPERIRNSLLLGEVLIGDLNGEVEVEGATIPCGIYHATLSNSVVLGSSLVYRVELLSNYVVKSGAVIYGAGTVSFEPGSTMGNGVELSLAIETGGREIRTFAELTIPVAEKIAGDRHNKKLIGEYEEFIEQYLSRIKRDRGVISEGARVICTPLVKNTFLGPYALVHGAQKLENSTLLSNEEEPTEVKEGAIVESSILQWGSEVTSMGIASEAVLSEHSHVERHGKLTQSIIGPNTGVAEGEVTASLVGPFVGFHHQALLIAAFWPEGKGNVGYGANVGSNHTSKAPDQEIWCGEGAFFGLGVNVKFPANFRDAPYSIIATGVTTLPQKVDFPFSLINVPRRSMPGISPAFNEITPAWVLSDNLFTLKRNEKKYKKRNKARRTEFVFDVFRPDTVAMMMKARAKLKNVSVTKELYTDKDIPGLGKNFLLEENRKRAIEVYTFFINYYALLQLKEKLEKEVKPDVLTQESDDEKWEQARKIILDEFPGKSVKELLEELSSMQGKIAESVEESKRKDDVRGRKIIDDYDTAHTSAEDDDFVKETWEETENIKNEVAKLLEKLS